MSIPMPFTLHVSDDDIADLHARLAQTRFPDQVSASPWAYGTDLEYLRNLVAYWRDSFDWRTQEERLDVFPQFKGPYTVLICTTCMFRDRDPIRNPCCCCMAGPDRCSSSWTSSRASPIPHASAAMRRMRSP
jgi:hypothetical protein